MQIIKKDGRVEEFDPSKIRTSLNNAASQGGVLLNESDLHVLAHDVTDKLISIRGEKWPTSSYEVIGAIISTLKDDKFSSVVDVFINFPKKDK